MGITTVSGVTASGGGSSYTPPTYPSGMNANGLTAGGAYGSYTGVPSVQVVAASAIPSWTFNQARYTNTGNLFDQFDTIAAPPNQLGPDGWYELYIEWSCSNSAVTKQIQIVWDHTNGTAIDVQTTNQTSVTRLRITNRNKTTTNMVSGNPAGGGANAIQTLAMDLSQIHRFAIWGAFGSAPGASDFIRIERWSLTAFNPTVYSSARIQYGTKMFYGANSHWDDSQTIAFHIAGLKTMGMKIVRLAYEGSSSLSTLVAWAQALQADGTGIQMLCCLDFGMGISGVDYPDEATAYIQTYATVQPVVQALNPYGVVLFECGNEMDTKDGINTGDQSGGLSSDFNNQKVIIFRGTQRGAIDAVHSVPGCLACSNAYTVCSIGLSDMMWNGTQPDGTSGHPLVRWDITSWHNYEDYGPLIGVEMGNSRPWVNIFEHINRTYGTPIMITEWNSKQSDTDAQRANWASRFMYEAYANRYKYNIASIFVYELYGSPWQVLDPAANTPISTFGTTVQSFISSNPDTGF